MKKIWAQTREPWVWAYIKEFPEDKTAEEGSNAKCPFVILHNNEPFFHLSPNEALSTSSSNVVGCPDAVGICGPSIV